MDVESVRESEILNVFALDEGCGYREEKRSQRSPQGFWSLQEKQRGCHFVNGMGRIGR